jgi:MFS family permease
MKIVLTAVGGILIGPFAGFFGTYWLCSLNAHHDCMWRFGAFFASVLIGGPVGMLALGLTGFCVGYWLDKRAKRRRSEEEGSPFGAE